LFEPFQNGRSYTTGYIVLCLQDTQLRCTLSTGTEH
jgi:hypothetical protein